MRPRLDLACFVALALLGACSDDSGDDNGNDNGNEQEEGTQGERDLDGGRDASRMDARADDEEELDASKDAGRDASSVKRDASVVDAALRDADAETAPGPDASEPETDASEPEADAGASNEDGGRSDAGVATNCGELTYENFGREFLAGYNCVLCHNSLSGPAGVRLDTLAGVVAASDRPKKAVLNRSMPLLLPPFPTEEERARFAQWIDCGAPE